MVVVESSRGVQRLVRVTGAVQDGRGAVLRIEEVSRGLGADAGAVDSLRGGGQFGVVFSALPVRPLWMAAVHTAANLCKRREKGKDHTVFKLAPPSESLT